MMKKKTISIALCTYNGEKYLREQLDSLVNQSLKPNEIVVSDDNSKDDTIKIVKEYRKNNKDIKFKIHINNPGLGVYKNFEKAISLCTSDIIFCCDQDDVWNQDKVKKTYKEFKKGINLVFSNASVTEADVNDYIGSLWNEKQIVDRINSPYKTLVFEGGSIAGCCMAFTKEFVDGIYPFPDKIYHDDWLATCAAIKGNIKNVNEELMCYRQHGNNEVGIKRGSKLSYYKSLLTNTKPYLEHREYIYGRNRKMFDTLIDRDFVEDKIGLKQCLEFNRKRANIGKQPFSITLKNCLNDYKKTNYDKYANGFNDFVYDLYLGIMNGKKI